MNKLIKMLPALGMVLAATFAFAFTSAESDDPQFGTPDNGETWIQVNDPQNPVNYQCNAGSQACLYQDESMSNPIGTTDKQFVLIP